MGGRDAEIPLAAGQEHDEKGSLMQRAMRIVLALGIVVVRLICEVSIPKTECVLC